MEYLTTKEACERLKVHPNTMLRWLADGTIKGIRFGKLWRIPDTEIDRIDDKENRDATADTRQRV